MSRLITIDHNGTEYGGQIGTVASTRLGYESHGILTVSLIVEWAGGGVSVGGFILDTPTDPDNRDYSRRGTAFGLDHIIRIIETVGVSAWEDLKGRQLIVLFEGPTAWGAQSVGIASTTDESSVLVFKEHAETWLGEARA
ncbi:hypothetical protein [Microbacterium sp. gxy059]|uniref:hypothetical protein n=1 Tax=Microbacterium sp. gxy059 TaxID=2957199 RepID=UPI003D96EA0D